MSASIEKQAKRALRRAVFWRLVGDTLALPRVFLNVVVTLCNGLAAWFRNIEVAVFYFELDAARKYKLLAGLDISAATGDLVRYGLLDAARNEQASDVFARERMGLDELES